MREYNTRQFSSDFAQTMRERTAFLENALIANRFATDVSLWSLEQGMSGAQYLRVLEVISCNKMTVSEYREMMVPRSYSDVAYSPFMLV